MKLEPVNCGVQWRCQTCGCEEMMLTNEHGPARWVGMARTLWKGYRHAKQNKHQVAAELKVEWLDVA